MPTPLTYIGFIAFIIAMLLLDLKVFHSSPHQISSKEAAAWVGVWVGIALAFGLILLFWQGPHRAAEYFSGYLIEYSLSVDNMFVFIVIFSYFRVPKEYQHQVLFYGILGAILFRGAFIAAGIGLISAFGWVTYIFGGLLIVTAVRVVRGSSEPDPGRNILLKFFNRHFRATSDFDGQKLFTVSKGKKVATALFVVLLVIETTDIVFAVDSIPAIFAVTRSAFIVLTSNLFAILGLRSLYFLLAETMSRLSMLKYGLALILALVGTKMLLADVIEIPVWVSLAAIVVVLGATVLASFLKPSSTSD
ncbi:MAG: TerC family protein [Actinomycetota bacterium]